MDRTPSSKRVIPTSGWALTPLGAAAAGVLACALALPACDRRGIEETTLEKGAERVPDTPAASAPPADTPVQASSETPWTIPDTWVTDPEPRPMRLATYRPPEPDGTVEIAVSRFAGRVGGELANINRWRGQMGLPAIAEDDLEAQIDRFETPGFDGYTARIESPAGVMLAAGVYDASIDQTWFVRATAPDAAAADRLQADLFGMARSIARPAEEDDG